MSSRQAEWAKRLRLKVLSRLGGKCKGCDESDWKLLNIDHRRANGEEEREVICTTTIWQRILKDPLYAKQFQILCVNCHRRKTLQIDPMLKANREIRNKEKLRKVFEIIKPLLLT